MTSNTGKLAGKVLFITGASRGIGRAIALKAASDGANIVIAAKTREPHPKLPGTIFTVAEEVEKVGGKCLPCVVDVRFEDQIQHAVDETIKRFGRLDILVNNASAISLTGTSDTAMKTYDLMHSINARGTFLCSKLCIPHLEKSGPGSHILNLSPPLNMSPKWFENHVAYTMAKYGMSMCVLGMSEELKQKNIAVNALWPKTAIYTAAMEMLGGGKDVSKICRKPEIMADAAYLIFCQSSTFTGNFLVDEDVLRDKSGITNFEHYSCVPGQKILLMDDFTNIISTTGSKLMPDFFLESEQEQIPQIKSSKNELSVSKTFVGINKLLNEEAVKIVGASFAFVLTGSEPGTWFLDLKSGSGSAGKLDQDKVKDFDVQMILSSENFIKMFAGQLAPTKAFMSGDIKIKGNAFLAMKLESVMLKKVPISKL